MNRVPWLLPEAPRGPGDREIGHPSKDRASGARDADLRRRLPDRSVRERWSPSSRLGASRSFVPWTRISTIEEAAAESADRLLTGRPRRAGSGRRRNTSWRRGQRMVKVHWPWQRRELPPVDPRQPHEFREIPRARRVRHRRRPKQPGLEHRRDRDHRQLHPEEPMRRAGLWTRAIRPDPRGRGRLRAWAIVGTTSASSDGCSAALPTSSPTAGSATKARRRTSTAAGTPTPTLGRRSSARSPS